MPANALTDLKLVGIGVQPYSARGLTQQLTAIAQSVQVRRTVNGLLRDISLDQFKKYSSVITGSDQQPPVCDGVWPGRIVQVECLSELSAPLGELLERPAVAGSLYEDGGFQIYRPVLTMMVVAPLEMTRDEYNRQVSWTLTLEEV
jgi:hypothetical protein